MVQFRAQPGEPEAVLPALVDVQAEDVDGESVAVVDEGVRESGEQLVVALAGRRVGHDLEGQRIQFCGGQGSVDRDSMGRQGREDLDQPLTCRRVDVPGPEVLMATSLPPWL